MDRNRHDVTDEYGREPLITTKHGRPSSSSLYNWVNKATHPCEHAECPHDRDPSACEARGRNDSACKCPSARSPHAIRRGSITHELNDDTPPEAVSERMDVTLDVLYEHYDARTPQEKMEVRKRHFEEEA